MRRGVLVAAGAPPPAGGSTLRTGRLQSAPTPAAIPVARNPRRVTRECDAVVMGAPLVCANDGTDRSPVAVTAAPFSSFTFGGHARAPRLAPRPDRVGGPSMPHAQSPLPAQIERAAQFCLWLRELRHAGGFFPSPGGDLASNLAACGRLKARGRTPQPGALDAIPTTVVDIPETAAPKS